MRKLNRLALFAALLASSACFVLAETPTPKPQSETGLEGVISIGPTRPGPTRQGIPDSKPLADTEFLVAKENITVASFKTDGQGRFRVSLPPGHYTISRKDWNAKIGSSGPFEVDVTAGQMKVVHWECDTGIR